MASLNRITIIGNLGRDPEIKTFPNGKKAEFTVAVTERWRDRNQQDQETTEWFNVGFWGRQAEVCEQYLRKGMSVYIEGKIRTRSWEDQNGAKHYRTEVHGDNLQMLSRRENGGGGSYGQSEGSSYGNSGAGNYAPRASAPAQSADPFAQQATYSAPEDDLPF